MSSDLIVATLREPSTVKLGAWLRTHGDRRVTSSGGVIILEGEGGGSTTLSIEGPFRVEAKDLPDEVLTAVMVPHWTMQLAASAGSTQAGWAMLSRVARWIAEHAEGVVFDPQEGPIVWLRSKARRRAVVRGERSTKVEFSWAIPRDESRPNQVDIGDDSAGPRPAGETTERWLPRPTVATRPASAQSGCSPC